MRKPVVFLFSGQGSQYYHMGEKLYNNNTIFRKWMTKLDSIALEVMGQSIIRELYKDSKRISDIFNRTLITHPAIFMVEYSLARTLQENGIEPDYVLGSSLGEFVSAAVADVTKVEELLICVIRQAEILEKYCQSGGMIAVVDTPRIYSENPEIYENSDLASVNFHSHFVVSGSDSGLRRVVAYLNKKKYLFQELPVVQAFHSSIIQPAKEEYMKFLNGKIFKKPKIPFLSCLFGNIVNDIQERFFWDIVRCQIRFPETLKRLEGDTGYLYIDIGPSGTLANFTKYNLPKNSKSEIQAIITPFCKDERNLDMILMQYR